MALVSYPEKIRKAVHEKPKYSCNVFQGQKSEEIFMKTVVEEEITWKNILLRAVELTNRKICLYRVEHSHIFSRYFALKTVPISESSCELSFDI
jgi:hypothetical protein